MCTAVTYNPKDFYFGRTLDNDFSFSEQVTVTPRNFRFGFAEKDHYAIIGMAFNRNGYPLYYDAANEKGLCMAGLNFVGNAYYEKAKENTANVAQYELIPYILCRCASVKEAVREIKCINITDTQFSADLPTAQLHWLIADKDGAVTLECAKNGINIYENRVGVLTNNPAFPQQMINLNNYMHLSSKDPKNTFSENLDLSIYCKGMGAIGLPGDFSSMSRFVRAAFVKENSVSGSSNEEGVIQFFHILGAVCQQRGCCVTEKGYEITVYTSCINASRGIYYYTTYENSQINGVNMHREDLNSDKIITYNLKTKANIEAAERT